MRQPDTSIISPYIKDDISATRELAAAFSKLSEMMRDIYSKLGTVEVRTTLPAVGELHTEGDGRGNIISDIIILDDATAGNRKIYYKEVGGTLRAITSA